MNNLIRQKDSLLVFLLTLFTTMFEASVEKFNEYVIKNNISAVKKGDLFEQLTLEILRSLGFSVRRGQSQIWNQSTNSLEIIGDNGIDLDGNIVIQGHRLNILVQCKCYQKTKINSEQIRSFDNVLTKYPNHIGIFMVYDKRNVEERPLLEIKNSVRPIYLMDITTINNIIQELEKDIELYKKIPDQRPRKETIYTDWEPGYYSLPHLGKIKVGKDFKCIIKEY